MDIEVSEDLLKQFQGALTKKSQLMAEVKLIDTQVELITERILRQAGVDDMDAQLEVNTENWTFRTREKE